MNLKPCPFCGSKNLHFAPAGMITVHGGGREPAVVIGCMECPAEMIVNDQDVAAEEVVAMWNRRTQ